MFDEIFFIQFKTVVRKNFLLALRNKELVTDIAIPLILAILLIFQKYLAIIQFLSPALFSMAIAGSARSLLIHMVEEKSERQKETQKIMGLRQSSYIIGWLSTSYARALLSCFLFMIPISIGQIEGLSNVGQLFLCYIFYTFAVTHFALVLSCFFSSPKLAGQLGTLFIIVTGLASFLQLYDQFSADSFNFYLLGLFPTSSIAFGYITCYQGGVFETTNQENYSVNQCMVQLLIEMSVYIILYFYLDQIIPNQYGVRKHPLFFLGFGSKKEDANENQVRTDIEEQLIAEDQQEKMGDMSSALYHEKFENKGSLQATVQIRKLVQQFGEFTAVDRISLNLYERNIFCLLGHNGAGQTTTISMLTGMIAKTEGDVRVYGKRLDTQLDEIRRSVGLCTQRDVLYENLTFQETLRFYGQVKGVTGEKLEQQVNYILNKTGSNGDRTKLVKELSGGNQRKLSLGCALIGGSKLVFLDEPTSGMDAISRKKLWEIMQSVRNESRTILLTTHHLDQAQALADRIAIMSRGKLLALGTNQFIKKNFGIGYQLRLTPVTQLQNAIERFQSEKAQICQTIQKVIPQAIQNPQTAEDTVIFVIPFKYQKQFVPLFQELDSFNNITINLEMNSLEDAFVNIGMDEEIFIEQSVKNNAKGINDRNSFKLKEISGGKRDSLRNEEQKTEGISNKGNNEENDEFYTNFQNIVIPECLNNPPQYQFMSQFLAVFLRRYYCTVRNYVNWFAFFMMLLIVVLGTVVVNFISFPSEFPPDAIPAFQLSFLSSFLTMAFCFSSSAFILLPVMEREYNLKYALNVMGCRVTPYWLGTLAFDYIVFVILITAFITLSYIFQFDFVTNYIGQIIVILLAFGLAYITFSYMFGFVFTRSNVALQGFPLFNFIITWSVPWTILGILNLFRNQNYFSENIYVTLNDITQVLSMFLSPFWTINMGISVITFVSVEVNGFKSMLVVTSDWWVYALVLVANGVIFGLFTYYLEQRKYDLKANTDLGDPINNMRQGNNMNYSSNPVKQVAAAEGAGEQVVGPFVQNNIPQQGPMSPLAGNPILNFEGDDLVLAQRKRIFSNVDNDQIRVLELKQTYENGYTAIRNNTFAANQGEIFGLLGPNGAGKSTTFNILTSLIPKSGGSVQIQGIEVNQGIMEIYQDVGICPQFDCLWEHLTPNDHLYLFGRMKGLSGADLDASVKYFLQVMQLTDYINRKAGRLSGGNKRKLCVTNALIGGPDIQFFDEPSTGVDPIARRFLWNTLNQGLKLRNSAICLTTHTMEEAESLCTKIGILINGQFQTIGTPQQLRDQYGTGFTLTIKATSEQFIAALSTQFPKLRRMPNKQEGYFTFHITKDEFNFYQAFNVCQNELKENGLIEDFSIRQSSLEQVFMFFSRYQISQENQDNNGPSNVNTAELYLK